MECYARDTGVVFEVEAGHCGGFAKEWIIPQHVVASRLDAGERDGLF